MLKNEAPRPLTLKMQIPHSFVRAELVSTLRSLDPPTAHRFERLVRDARELVQATNPSLPEPDRLDEWMHRLDQIRSSVGTGRQSTSTEEILGDLRSEHDA